MIAADGLGSEAAAGLPLYYQRHAAARRHIGFQRPQHNLIRQAGTTRFPVDEAPKSESSTQVRPNNGPLLILGLPFAIEVLTLYVLIAIETPLTPLVNRLLQNALGIFTLACIGLLVVCAAMPIVLTIAERRHRSRQAQRDAGAV
jgi:hypothetical protein